MSIVPYSAVYDNALFKAFLMNTPVYFDKAELHEFQSYLQTHAQTYFVLKENNSIVGGFGYELRAEDKSARINWIFIDPAHKHKGYGKLAVRFCLQQFKQQRAFKYSIVRTSQHAFEFFRCFGYELMETKTDFWAPGIDLYLMKLDLTS
jgi:ribosomal-protein-alanine N-acetyltransferase